MTKDMRVILFLVFLGVFGGGIFLCSEEQEHNATVDEMTEESAPSIEERVLNIESKFASFEESLNIMLVANKNPQELTESSLSRGREVYLDNCVMCHGSDGRGSGPLARAIPNIPDLTGSHVQRKSDEELFNVITDGDSPMPAFNSLDEQDRWNLVNFIRSFAEKK